MAAKSGIANYRTLFWLLLINFFITIGISYFYIVFSGSLCDRLSIFFVHFALPSNFILIYLAFALLLYLLTTLSKNKYYFTAIGVILFSLIHFLNIIDLTIFRMYKFHINGMVLNLLLTEGSGDSLLLLGYTTDPRVYSQGRSLLQGQGDDFIISSH